MRLADTAVFGPAFGHRGGDGGESALQSAAITKICAWTCGGRGRGVIRISATETAVRWLGSSSNGMAVGSAAAGSGLRTMLSREAMLAAAAGSVGDGKR